MSLVESAASSQAASSARRNVALSPWVNERFPAWTELLSAHDVARLTRRHPLILSVLAALGKFPRELRFRGRGVGWSRSEIADWLTKSQGDLDRDCQRSGDHCSVLRVRSPPSFKRPRCRTVAKLARVGFQNPKLRDPSISQKAGGNGSGSNE